MRLRLYNFLLDRVENIMEKGEIVIMDSVDQDQTVQNV